ncbi:MAG: MFS transporter, partial [Gammaproteobacteria bacterium]
MSAGPGLPRTVLVLGGVSLLNDLASEMITPLLPLFLTGALGAGPAAVGLVEGAAEAAASLLKLASGRLADRGWSARGLVLGGYGLSNLARPLIGLAGSWGAVLGLRVLDRVGKGLRTAPRDGLISAAVAGPIRGRAFGFHRAMDHLGAMLGPLAAFALLAVGVGMREVFLASALFGALVLGLLLWGLPRGARLAPLGPAPSLRWGLLDARLRRLLVGIGLLALATVPEAFLVLWAAGEGLAAVWVPLLWAAAHAVKAAVAAPAGRLADRWGRLPVVGAGWAARVLLLLLLAAPGWPLGAVWALFLAYGAALAFTEGAERALVGDLAPRGLQGTAFGL